MKKGLIAASIILALLLIIFFSNRTSNENSFIDLRLHDIYFVVRTWTFSIVSIIILLFAFSFVASSAEKFKNKLFNWMLFLSSAGIISICIYLYSVLRGIK